MPEPLHIFVSYSHKDEAWLEELRVHLKPLVRDGLVAVWDDSRIEAGKRWKTEIKAALAAAQVAILLVSKHFLASDFIINDELQPLLAAAEKKGVLILPVIVSPCRFLRTPSLSVFQAINHPSRPLARLKEWERDEIFVQITERIESALQEVSLAAASPPAAETRVPARRPSKQRKEEGDPAAKAQPRKSSEPETNVRIQTKEKPPPPDTPRETPPQTWQNALGMPFARIPAGAFEMGSEEEDREKPVHPVTISRSFYLGTTVVTQGQWKAVMGTKPWKRESYVKEGDAYPAVYVSWEDAQAFIKKLNGQEDASRYRLPTEAEWEYACRAGSTTRYSFGDDASELGEYAWYGANAWDVGERYAHRVGQKQPNSWGLYDMHGNVWEWVEDWFGGYPSGAVTDPTGPATGSNRVFRGGGWNGTAGGARSADRDFDPPGSRDSILGFRLVRMAL